MRSDGGAVRRVDRDLLDVVEERVEPRAAEDADVGPRGHLRSRRAASRSWAAAAAGGGRRGGGGGGGAPPGGGAPRRRPGRCAVLLHLARVRQLQLRQRALQLVQRGRRDRALQRADAARRPRRSRRAPAPGRARPAPRARGPCARSRPSPASSRPPRRAAPRGRSRAARRARPRRGSRGVGPRARSPDRAPDRVARPAHLVGEELAHVGALLDQPDAAAWRCRPRPAGASSGARNGARPSARTSGSASASSARTRSATGTTARRSRSISSRERAPAQRAPEVLLELAVRRVRQRRALVVAAGEASP